MSSLCKPLPTMNKNCLILVVALFCASVLPAASPNTVVYTINGADEDASIDDYHPNQSNPNEIEYCSGSWTIFGAPVIWRSLLRFNLNCIPTNATIVDARLSLYFATQNNFGDTAHSSLTHSDECVIQRVTGPWSETNVNWNNQPATTTNDEVVIPQSVTGTDDYLNLNVTSMVQQMIGNSSPNYGFMVKATNETPYARMFFASGDNPDSLKHPTLSITYTIPLSNCITLTLDSTTEDASIDDYKPAQNNPNEIEYCTGSWTINGTPVIWRDIFRFPLPCELNNMHVDHASLSLYYASQNNFGNTPHSNLTHSDESIVQRVTGPWSESTVTWNNQPSTTSANEVSIPQSITGTDDYLNLDVTAMVQVMIEHPDSSFGFMVKAINETPYARMLFASGDNPDVTKHPKLEICYSQKTGIDDPEALHILPPFPNPAANIIFLQGDLSAVTGFQIVNSIGEVVLSSTKVSVSTELGIDIAELSNGLYILQLNTTDSRLSYRIVVSR